MPALRRPRVGPYQSVSAARSGRCSSAPSRAMSPRLIMAAPRNWRSLLPLMWLFRWPRNGFLNRTFPLAVTLTRLSKPLCDFCLGITEVSSQWNEPHIVDNADRDARIPLISPSMASRNKSEPSQGRLTTRKHRATRPMQWGQMARLRHIMAPRGIQLATRADPDVSRQTRCAQYPTRSTIMPRSCLHFTPVHQWLPAGQNRGHTISSTEVIGLLVPWIVAHWSLLTTCKWLCAWLRSALWDELLPPITVTPSPFGVELGRLLPCRSRGTLPARNHNYESHLRSGSDG